MTTQERDNLELKERLLWERLKRMDSEREQVRVMWADAYNQLRQGNERVKIETEISNQLGAA